MHKYLTVFLVAMVPVAELRLAVPMAIGMGIDQFLAIAICVAGNIVPVPLSIFLPGGFSTGGQSSGISESSAPRFWKRENGRGRRL